MVDNLGICSTQIDFRCRITLTASSFGARNSLHQCLSWCRILFFHRSWCKVYLSDIPRRWRNHLLRIRKSCLLLILFIQKLRRRTWDQLLLKYVLILVLECHLLHQFDLLLIHLRHKFIIWVYELELLRVFLLWRSLLKSVSNCIFWLRRSPRVSSFLFRLHDFVIPEKTFL